MVGYAAIVDGIPADGPRLTLGRFGLARNDGRNGCDASVRVVRGHRGSVIEIVGKPGADPKLLPPPADCPPAGARRYAWDGARLVEIP
jgi:hypothetical protein